MKQLTFTLLTMMSITSFGQIEDINQFMNAMKEGNDLVKFLKLPENLESEVFINFVLVEKFEIKQITETSFEVYNDTGKGHYSMRLLFEVVKMDDLDRWLILPSILENEFYNDLQVVNPWKYKERIE